MAVCSFEIPIKVISPKGKLVIKTVPEGVKVYIDGKFVGTT